jgi:hypothetical protein
MGIVLFMTRPVLASLAPPAVPDGLAIPATAIRTSTDLSGRIELIGYELGAVRTGEPLTVTVYWQANHLLSTSYKSFVHVTDVQGRLVAQSDAIPRNWTYPTSAWFPNERVVDPHRLDLPPGASGPLQVWAGMYDPETGERLKPKDDPTGAIKLGTLMLGVP